MYCQEFVELKTRVIVSVIVTGRENVQRAANMSAAHAAENVIDISSVS
jgi:hypothetical protein